MYITNIFVTIGIQSCRLHHVQYYCSASTFTVCILLTMMLTSVFSHVITLHCGSVPTDCGIFDFFFLHFIPQYFYVICTITVFYFIDSISELEYTSFLCHNFTSAMPHLAFWISPPLYVNYVLLSFHPAWWGLKLAVDLVQCKMFNNI